MQRRIQDRAALAFLMVSMAAAACGRKQNEQSAAGNVAPPTTTQPGAVPNTPYGAPAAPVETATTRRKHHSKIAGAAGGAVVGHVVGHPIIGAATGAIVQHERNKHHQ